MNKGQFKPGQSGNPGGRPKVVGKIRTLARAHTTTAISTLAEVMRSKKAPPAARVAAASVLLDRGYGKPMQPLKHSGTVKHDVVDLTEAELIAIARGDRTAPTQDKPTQPDQLH